MENWNQITAKEKGVMQIVRSNSFHLLAVCVCVSSLFLPLAWFVKKGEEGVPLASSGLGFKEKERVVSRGERSNHLLHKTKIDF